MRKLVRVHDERSFEVSIIRKLDRDPIVAFHVAYAKLPGSDPVCALFLSQVSYWCSRAEDGVAWITHQAMYDQTGMSRKQQDRAAAYWESVGVMTKFIKGIPPKIHYFIDYARLEQFLMEEHDGQVDVSERDRLDVPNGQHVMSERGKTSNEDSKDSQRLLSDLNSPATKQQPEKATKKAASAQAQAIYDIYPLKVGRGVAIPKIELAIKDCGFDQLLEATKAYAAATRTWTEQDQKFIPHPSTWYHQQRYRDDQREWTRKSVVPVINLQPGARFGSFGHRE